MSHHIDPDVMYRIRSRGLERPAVEGHRLPQLVRDFVLARHDELSEDGEMWFPASEVESLFPSASNARLIRERQHRGPGEHPEEYATHVEDDRQFPREPWYVARASNVAGPYDQLTITRWYDEGCLRDDDQLRPGLHAKWRTLTIASNDGLLDPPPANTCSVNPIHLVADPPVWMGPPTTTATQTEEWTSARQQSSQFQSTPFSTNLPLIVATVGVFVLFLASLAGLAWFVLNLNRQSSKPDDFNDQVASRTGQTEGGSMPARNSALADRFSLLVPLLNQITEAGERIEIPLVVSDPSRRDEIRFQLTSAPSTVSIDGSMLTWVPDASDAGQTHIISVQVNDAANPGAAELVSFEIEVMPASVVAPDPIDAEEGIEIDAVVDLGLRAQPGLTYSLVGSVPRGLRIDEPTGRLRWVPSEEQSPMVVNLGVQAHNPSGRMVAETELRIRVAERNRILEPDLPVALAGETTLIQLKADTPRRGDRFFFAKGRIKGMFLDPDSGELRWNPGVDQAPAVYNVTVGLSDRITLPTDPSRFDHRDLAINVMLSDRMTSMKIPFFSGTNQKQRLGHVQLAGKLHKAILISPKAEDFSELQDLQLVVDLDNDGTLYAHDGSAERFALSDPMNFNGQVYLASRPSSDGSSLTLSRTSRKAQRKPYLVPGYAAPMFQAQTTSGKTFDLRRECARSQYVLLEFWADWCPPCRRMYEDLSEIHRKYKNRGLTIVGVNRDHDLQRASTAIRDHGLAYDHVFDNVDDSPGIGKKYRVKSIPRTYLLDSSMQIVALNLRGEALKKKLQQLLVDPN